MRRTRADGERSYQLIVDTAARLATVEGLELLCERYLSDVERGVFPGGCVFAATAAEWNSRRGPIRERVRTVLDGWTQLLEASLRGAQQRGELERGADLHQITFEINALLHEANGHYVLYGNPAALDRARKAIHDRLAHPQSNAPPERGRPPSSRPITSRTPALGKPAPANHPSGEA